MHSGVKTIDFSPCGTYVITSQALNTEGKEPVPDAIKVWRVKNVSVSGANEPLRSFDSGHSFKWSFDGKYIARLGKDMISVYETPSMNLLDKTSFKIPGVAEVQFNPACNMMSYWVPEKDNIPARIGLIEIPSRKLIRESHSYNASDITMQWHSKGEYLCVKVTRKKSKTQFTHNFEIFRIKQKNIPVDTITIEDSISAFAWEPNGHRFAIIHHPVQSAKPSVSVYVIKKKEVKLVGTLIDRKCEGLFWSPVGNTILLAGGAGEVFGGALEWVDVNTITDANTMVNNMQTLSLPDITHDNSSWVQWDPSGRYVITCATRPVPSSKKSLTWRETNDNGYKVWSAQGKELYNVQIPHCYQIQWRPRPSSPLTKEKQLHILSTLKEEKKGAESYWSRFSKEDEVIHMSTQSDLVRERNMLKETWRAMRRDLEKQHREDKQFRTQLRHGQESDDEEEFETIHITAEELMDVVEEIIE